MLKGVKQIYFCSSFQPLNYFAKRIVEKISTQIYFAVHFNLSTIL
jgi:hypothetical protein